MHKAIHTQYFMAEMVKNLPAMQETQVRYLGQEDPLEKGMATQSHILARRILRTEDPVGYSPWGCKELDKTKQLTYTHIHTQVAPRKHISLICGWDLWKLYLYWNGTLKWWVKDWENMAPRVFFPLKAVILLLCISFPLRSVQCCLLHNVLLIIPTWLNLVCVCDSGFLFFYHSIYYRIPVHGSQPTSSRTRTMYSISEASLECLAYIKHCLCTVEINPNDGTVL